jgi:exodeoxyribonuclease V alpha subunit
VISAQAAAWQQGVVSDFDLHFSRLMEQLSGRPAPELRLAAALASATTSAGHVCVHLAEFAGQPLFGYAAELGELPPVAPALMPWTDALRTSPVVGEPGEFRPLVLDQRNRLYLYRYWDYERRLASALLTRASEKTADVNTTALRAQVKRLFPSGGDTDWQQVAATVAVLQPLSVITGGPGTGKTTTVARILAILIEQASADLRVALSAPTGKAAGRLQQTMRAAKRALAAPASVVAAIPDTASTIHRLLGFRHDGSTLRYHEQRPLPLDVLVVDEASMIDLALMTKLVAALPAQARLILLGDKDQLASVEAGSVLADMCGEPTKFSPAFASEVAKFAGPEVLQGSEHGSPMRDCIVPLQRNFRFGNDAGIASLARAINHGDSESAVALLTDSRVADVTWRPITSAMVLHAYIRKALAAGFEPYWQCISEGRPLEESLERLNGLRILCAYHSGPAGARFVNQLVEQALQQGRRSDFGHWWYPGRPIMITRNDYAVGLFNGDVGIALPDPLAGGRIRVYFASDDGAPRRFSPSRLPENETVYAMTVHKAQGSEFDRVALILPADASPLLTRELLYTAITRARVSVEIVASEEVLRSALAARLRRGSGLHERLWHPGPW